MSREINFDNVAKPSLQDLTIVAAFKARAASTIEDPDAAALFQIQALELQRMIDEIIKQVDPNYPTIAKMLPSLMATNHKKLALSAGQIKIEFEKVTGLNTDVMQIDEIQEEMTKKVAQEINKNLPKSSPIFEFPVLQSGKSICDFAKEVLKQGSTKTKEELDEDYLKMVKDSLEANIKSGNRFEAIAFLKQAFRDQHWSDIDCHRFINKFKESYEIQEPSKRPKKNDGLKTAVL